MVIIMRTGKDWKYYIKFYIMVTVVYFLYVSIIALRQGGYQPYSISTVLFLPPIFVGFVALFDRAFDPFFRKLAGKKKINITDYNIWIHDMDKLIHEHSNFTIEEYRRLRESKRFQKSLTQAHRILTEGESEELSLTYLRKKFKTDTNESKALEIVLQEVEKTLENQ